MINVRILNKSQISSTVCSIWQNTACRDMGVLGQFLVGWRRESFPGTGHNFHFCSLAKSNAATQGTDKKECRTTANTVRTHWNLRSATVTEICSIGKTEWNKQKIKRLSKWMVNGHFLRRVKKHENQLFFLRFVNWVVYFCFLKF